MLKAGTNGGARPTEKTYIAIDLKSFYASVECVSRGLDPLDANLVVADVSRTEKTICLAVSPPLKKYGIPGRARLFEVVQKAEQINRERLYKAPEKKFSSSSFLASELDKDPSLKLDYIAATPRMSLYMEISTKIYGIYLRYIAPEDIHVYSVDEVFIDATPYLTHYNTTAESFAKTLISEVLSETGITATAGIGTNLYLCKIAMDIEAKHIEPDENGVRIASLDEMSYRRKLWNHRPLTDFWRIGRGYSRTLEKYGLRTMGDIARCSLGDENEFYNENLLYKLFGINAELLIDHAWGWEPCTIADIKAYKPQSSSISSGQVLKCPYSFEKGRLIVREMTDLLVLDLVEKGILTDQMELTVGYDVESLSNPEKAKEYKGEITTDHYGRAVPKPAHGSINLGRKTSSSKLIIDAVTLLYEKIVDKELLVRRMYVVANNIVSEKDAAESPACEQLDLFTDYEQESARREEEEAVFAKEKRMQETVISIKKKFGKNAVLRGMNFSEGATAIERNGQVGGHRA